ncbi:MAG: serine hydrolase domain-containing protein [Planctomycetota bacterium]|nr:serine hydrolase domain-containing protein [Planctomycetota bacterium]
MGWGRHAKQWSARRAARRFRAVERVLGAQVPRLLEAGGAPGVSVAVSVGGVRVCRAYGWANVAAQRPMTVGSVFRVCSISKPMSAFGVMGLHRAGVLDLDEPVARYLRSWSLGNVPNVEGVTLRRILSHTAGLGVHHYGTPLAAGPAPSTAGVLSGVCGGTQVGLVAEPGAGVLYSGGGYTLAQMVVEDVTGKAFETYMREAVFEPLGMVDTGYGRTCAGLATGHDRAGRAVLASFLPAASSGLCSTPADLVRFWDALVPGPSGEPAGRGLILPEDAELMRQAQAQARAQEPDGPVWGMGFCIGSNRLGETYQHAGWADGWWAFAMGVADRGVSLAVVINSDTGREWGREVVRRVVKVL